MHMQNCFGYLKTGPEYKATTKSFFTNHMILSVCAVCVHACVGRTQLTDAEPAKEIPLGWYDCGDGLYNPQNRVVYTYEMKFLRNAGRNYNSDI